MGLFGFGKGRRSSAYERPRADAPPDGWVQAQALVDVCDAERTNQHFGPGNRQSWVVRTTTTYVVTDQHGASLPIVVEAKLSSRDVPKQGARLMVAYDPSDPTAVLVLCSEEEYAQQITDDAQQAVKSGIQAPCEIVTATATGRVSRPKAPPLPKRARARNGAIALGADPAPRPAPEFLLTFGVTPVGAEPFQLTRTLWDRDLGLAAGLRGTFFFLPDDPARGYPVFPREAHRAAGGDPVRLARDEFVAGLADESTVFDDGRLRITRTPMRLEG